MLQKRLKEFSSLLVLLLLLSMVIGCDDIPSDATLTLTSPKNGDRWEIGTPNNAEISWENDGVRGNVILSLLFEEDSLVTIINDTLDANTLHYFWTVPSNIIAASGYSVLLVSEEKTDIFSQSASIRVVAGSSTTVESLELTSPTNKDEWQAGKANGGVVRWVASDTSMNVTVELLRGEDIISTIADGRRSGNGLYRWSVPDTLTLARDYQVRITADHDSDLYDISSRFAIVELDTSTFLTLTEPTGKSTWQAGAEDEAVILWTSNNVDSTADISLINNGFEMTVAENVPVENGMYTWSVPLEVEAGNGYQIIVTPRAAPELAETSDRFRINAFENPATLEIIAPTNGDRWTAGEHNGAVIQWTSSNITGTVQIDLLRDGELFMGIAKGVAVRDGSYLWTVPSYLEGGSGFEVYMVSDEDEMLTATSAAFRINPSENPATIDITSPSSGDKWYILEDSTAVIEWTHENLFDSVRIDLYQSGSFITTVTPAVDVDEGQLQWTVPFGVLEGRNYQIYIESLRLPQVNAFSADFSIEESELSATLEIIDPSNGTSWEHMVEDGGIIYWVAENLPGTLTLLLEHDDYPTFTIAEGIPVSDTVYTWTVPAEVIPDRKYHVRATSDPYPQFTAVSGDFTISASDLTPTLEVTTPKNWTMGEETAVEWEFTNLDSTLTIDLLLDEEFLLTLTTEAEVDSLSFNVLVPDDLTESRNYHLRLTSNRYATIQSVSSKFNISEP